MKRVRRPAPKPRSSTKDPSPAAPGRPSAPTGPRQSSRDRPGAARFQPTDYGVALALAGVLLTFGQLSPGRAAFTCVAIFWLLVAFLVHRHVRKDVVKRPALVLCALAGVASLLAVQALPTGSPDTATAGPVPPTATVTVTVPAQADLVSSPRVTAPAPTGSPQVTQERQTHSIGAADSQSFLDGRIRVGVPQIFDWNADVTLATASVECDGDLTPGQSMVIVDQDLRWIRVSLLSIRRAESVSIDVSRGTGEAPAGQTCYR